MAGGFIVAHPRSRQAAVDLDAAAKAREHLLARRLTTSRGVGPINAFSFIALADDRSRSSRSADVGAFLGLKMKRHQFGGAEWSGRVSKCGDGSMRGLRFEVASCVIRQVKRFSALKSWAERLAGPRGFRKAAVVTARKVAGLMQKLWKTGADYRCTMEAAD
jgi:transposase